MRRRVFTPVAVSVLLVLAGLTALRNRDYASQVRLWERTLHCSPWNNRARVNLACAYLDGGDYASAGRVAGQLVNRLAHVGELTGDQLIAHGLRTGDPGRRFALLYYASGRNILGIVAMDAGDWEHAIAEFREAVRVSPGFVGAYSNMAVAESRRGRAEESVQIWKHVLKLQPANAKARQEVVRLSGALE